MKIASLRLITIVLILFCTSTHNLSALELQSANITQGLIYASQPADPRILIPLGDVRYEDHIDTAHFDDSIYKLSDNQWVAPGLRSAWVYLKHQLDIASKKLEQGEMVKPILTREQLIRLNGVIDLAKSEKWQDMRKHCLSDQDSRFAYYGSYIQMNINSISYDQFVELNKRYNEMNLYDQPVDYYYSFWQNSTAPELTVPMNTWQLRNIILSLPSWNKHNFICQFLDLTLGNMDSENLSEEADEYVQYSMKYCDRCQATGNVPQSGYAGSVLKLPYPSYHYYRAFEEILPELLTEYQSALEAAEAYEDILNVVADYTQKFIQLHPFKDGNGRTFRMFANYVLMLYGFAPLSFNEFSPIPLTQAQWREEFKLAQWRGHSILQKQLLSQ